MTRPAAPALDTPAWWPRLALLASFVALGLLGACTADDPVTGDDDVSRIDRDAEDAPGLDGFPSPNDLGDDADTRADRDTAGDASGVEPERTCERDEDCDDERDCTDDACGDDGFCDWTIRPNRCLINSVCRGNGDIAPNDPCAACVPSASPTTWSPRADGADCTDGNRCTVNTTCQAGQCLGTAVTCNDGNGCTDDQCDPAAGCLFPPLADLEPCDDGDPCTDDDACFGGECQGLALDCDDDDDCTDDACDPATGCTYAFNTGPCDDGDACTVDDVCDGGECLSGGPANCDDGNACTINGCDERSGCFDIPSNNACCVGSTSECDDGDPCTTDLCGDEPGVCEYELNTAACNDGNACTRRDTCDEGECVGTDIVCDDGDPCTDDFCDTSAGCQHPPLSDVECDDGIDCTIDTCVEGICVGDPSECVCEPDFAPDAFKATSLAIGTSGQPGQGLDVDDDPSTCSPSTNCSAGVDNALAPIASFVNEDLRAAVDDGSLILLVELRDFDLNPFEMGLYYGELDPANAGCAVQTATCSYRVDPASLDPACDPLVTLEATRVGDEIFGGGPGTTFPFEIPFGDAVLSLTLYEVQFEGDLVVVDGEITQMNGELGGAIRVEELLDALEALPPDALPFDPAVIAAALELLVDDDIDTDGNGTPDAASIGLPLESIPAVITGVLE